MSRHRRRPRSVAAVAALLLLGACAGPSSADQGWAETVTQGVDRATSAVAVGTLVVELVRADRTTAAAADTTLRDALLEVGEAQGVLTRDVPSDAAATTVRDRATAAADQGATALADARAWVNGTSPSDAGQVAGALSAATDALDAAGTAAGG